MQTPRDFEWLSDRILERTREYVSPTTLKRLWGYLDESVSPRLATLDMLSRFCGLTDFESLQTRADGVQSNLVFSDRLTSNDLAVGARVRLRWQPDRVCLVEHLGHGRFVVRESLNAKLSVGDTFECHLMVAHEPLYLDNLCSHQTNGPVAYVAGKKDGVIWNIEN